MKLAANDPSALLHIRCRAEGSCAWIMAWYHPELYHRVLTYSGTFVNQQWPRTPHGGWVFHEHLIPENPPSRHESGWKLATAIC